MRVAFGTAQLFGAGTGDQTSRQVLRAAVDAGCSWFDTAPSYGRGRSEEELGTLLREHETATGVRLPRTTKVGLAPVLGPPGARAVAVAAARRLLPTSVVDRLRARAADAVSGRFGTEEVRGSVERSLRRLGRLDRLLLHEVTPADVTDELLAQLAGWLASGDVAAVGVATRNELTPAVLAAGPGLFSVAHVAVGPYARPFRGSPAATTASPLLVGHGLLGDGGRELAAVQDAVAGNPEWARRWREVAAGTPFAGPAGFARVLFARAGVCGADEVLVATRDVARVAQTLEGPRREAPVELLDLVSEVASRTVATG